MGGTGVLAARSTGSHCGETATGWLVCASLVVCGRKAVRKAAATPMSTSTRKLEACFFSYGLRRGDVEISTAEGKGVHKRGQYWCSQVGGRGAESGELAPGREPVRAGLAARACMLTRRGLSRACFSLILIIGVETCSGQQGEWGSTSRRTARCEVQA